MTDYDCMTPDELALWRASSEGVNVQAKVPCIDCPAWFEAVAREQGCCNRQLTAGRPRLENADAKQLHLRALWRRAAQRRRDRVRENGASPAGLGLAQ